MQASAEDGGLGMKDICQQNKAFLIKIGFQLVANPEKLWVRILRAKYGWTDVLPVELRRINTSRLWRGLSDVWEVVRDGICWHIRDGNGTDFWNDKWLDECNTLTSYTIGEASTNSAPVAAMVDDNGGWDWHRIEQWLPQDAMAKIAAIKPPRAPETIDHVLRSCPRARRGWEAVIRPSNIDAFLSLPFSEWLQIGLTSENRFGHGDALWVTRFSVFCWIIWKRRCNAIFGRDVLSDAEWVQSAIHFVQQIAESQSSNTATFVAYPAMKDQRGSAWKRSANLVADKLAALRRDKDLGEELLENPPMEILDLLHQDIHGVNS
ncbi:hypothetical protein V6N11_049931 [Hibiscus sabdariffa]|uniref:Uncharacterized protein n=2 Tax=Hibiscus sabdariffa TaxID=183260 RepID=A0ABR2T8E9_9ROSI